MMRAVANIRQTNQPQVSALCFNQVIIWQDRTKLSLKAPCFSPLVNLISEHVSNNHYDICVHLPSAATGKTCGFVTHLLITRRWLVYFGSQEQ